MLLLKTDMLCRVIHNRKDVENYEKTNINGIIDSVYGLDTCAGVCRCGRYAAYQRKFWPMGFQRTKLHRYR